MDVIPSFVAVALFCSVIDSVIPRVMSATSSSGVPTYDLNEICARQATSFQLDVQPSSSVVFKLNASMPIRKKTDIWAATTTTQKPKLPPRRNVFSCVFSIKPKRSNTNTSLEVEWQNFTSECPDYVQISRPDENVIVYLEGTGRHFLSLSGAPAVDLHISICKAASPHHFLKIIAMSSAAPADNRSDVSSIVLAFLAPFAFILLAVVLAVLGSCCCAKKCNRARLRSGESGDPTSASSSAPGSPAHASGSRDTIFTITSLADKPPSYDDLFPADFVFPDDNGNKAHKPVTASHSTLSNVSMTRPTTSTAGLVATNVPDVVSAGQETHSASSRQEMHSASSRQDSVLSEQTGKGNDDTVQRQSAEASL